MACNCTDPFIGVSLENSTCSAASSVMFMATLNTLLRSRCDISDVCGRIKPTIEPKNEYDFIVIGGGGAGAVVAGRLSENPNWNVLLLEMGDDEPVGSQVPSFATDFMGINETTIVYDTEPQKAACLGNSGRICQYPRAKILGGCGVINGMTYMRGVPQDYDNWAAHGNRGWSYKDVLPFFRKTENNKQVGQLASTFYHGVGGPLTVEQFPDKPPITDDVLEAARSAGYKTPADLNGNVTEGFTIAQTMSIDGTRDSTARAYLRPARFRENLHIMLNSTVTKIHFTKDNGQVKAKSVEFYYRGTKYNIGINKEVILTAGTIGSPQLLLLSGIGPKSDLEKVNIKSVNDLPGVGKNFQNHVAFFVYFDLKNQENTNLLNWDSVADYVIRRKGPLTYYGLALVSSRYTSSVNPHKDWPDMQMYFNGYLANCTYGCGTNDTPADPQLPHATRKIVFQATLVRGRSRGYIKLRSNDPYEHPIIQPNYLTNEYDVEALLSGIRTAIKIGSASNLKEKYKAELVRSEYGNCSKKFKFDSDDFWRCAIRYGTYPENHLVGTCKMGPANDPMAVVSPELKVHGTSNVRVADAATFPRIVAGNIFATVVLMAEKAADFIKKDWS